MKEDAYFKHPQSGVVIPGLLTQYLLAPEQEIAWGLCSLLGDVSPWNFRPLATVAESKEELPLWHNLLNSLQSQRSKGDIVHIWRRMTRDLSDSPLALWETLVSPEDNLGFRGWLSTFLATYVICPLRLIGNLKFFQLLRTQCFYPFVRAGGWQQVTCSMAGQS